MRTAAAEGHHATVVAVGGAMHWFSDRWIHWGHWPEVYGMSRDAAHAMGDRTVEAVHLNYYAWALGMCEERFQDSLRYSARALTAARRADDTLQQAWAHNYAGWAHRFLGEGDEAVFHISEAAELFEAAGELPGSLTALQQRATTLRDIIDDQDKAIEVFQQLRSRAEEFEERIGAHVAVIYRVNSLAGQGGCHRRLRNWDEAVRLVRAAVELSRDFGNTAMEGRYLLQLGDTLLESGRTAEAREAFGQCAALGPDAGADQIAEARSRLGGQDAG